MNLFNAMCKLCEFIPVFFQIVFFSHFFVFKYEFAAKLCGFADVSLRDRFEGKISAEQILRIKTSPLS